MLDFIAYPLGKFLLFIYNTLAFKNYGLAIIFFTVLVRLAMLPLTLKQHKSTQKMQELQPIIADIQKRYKDDKEKLNQEMMKVYQENNYNPAGGCLPMLIQLPILLTLYWVISQPLKFMLSKSAEVIEKIVEVARLGLNLTVQQMGNQKEIMALSYFHENKSALSQVVGLLKESELINFNNFLGLHLGEKATYKLDVLLGPDYKIYVPLFILAIVATITTFISTKISMPKKDDQSKSQQNAQSSSMSNTMMYIGPFMTLMFSFQLPAGVVLYWMTGYIAAILQQLYINAFILKKDKKDEDKEGIDKSATGGILGNWRKMIAQGNIGSEGNGNTENGGSKASTGNGGNDGQKAEGHVKTGSGGNTPKKSGSAGKKGKKKKKK